MRQSFFAYAKTKQLISAFVFATRIVQFLFFLNPKIEASYHVLWLYRPVCVRTGRRLSRVEAQNILLR